MKHPASLALPLFLALACDAQESPDYQGEPIVQLQGTVTSNQQATSEATAAVLWYTSNDSSCQGPEYECGFGFAAPDGADFECANACPLPDSCDPAGFDPYIACVESCDGVEAPVAESTFEGCATGGIGESIPLSISEFPGSFELALFDEPPPGTLMRGADDGPRVAFGVLVALSADAPTAFDFESGFDAVVDSVLGGVTSHTLIYAADPIPAESAWGQYLGGAYDVGYHLVRYEADIDCEEFDDGCVVSNEVRSPEVHGFDVDLEMELAPLTEIVIPF